MHLVCEVGVGASDTDIIDVPVTFEVGSVIQYDGHVWSSVSTCPHEIPGVLALARGKTYGCAKNGRLLYKFQPADRSLPSIRVPYDDGMRNFSKCRTDRYSVIRGFPQLQVVEGRLQSVLSETFGEVGDQEAYDNYLLVKNGLRHSNKKLQRAARKAPLQDKASIKSGLPLDTAFTIDPEGCRDYDDAFSVIVADDWDGWCVSVHISNVGLVMGELGLLADVGELMQSVYLTTQTKGMLPPALANATLSLAAGDMRKKTLAFDFRVERSGSCRFMGAREAECVIIANFVYDTHDMTSSECYQLFQSATEAAMGHLAGDSHDEVAWWMVRYNAEAGAMLHKNRLGVFRVCEPIQSPVRTILHEFGLVEVADWESEYCSWRENVSHGALGCIAYAQASSPIRRRCDLVNQLLVLSLLGRTLSHSMAEFCMGNTTVKSIVVMNEHSRAAKKAERSSRLAEACRDASVMGRTVRGVCVERGIPGSNGIVVNEFYLSDLRLRAYARSFNGAVVGNAYDIVLHMKANTSGDSDNYALEVTHN